MTRRRRLTFGLILLIAALACNEHGLIPLDQAIDVVRIDIFTQAETNKIDILWVIDNSNSMCEEQDALTANFDTFIEGLAEISANFHIAVVTTDMSVNPGRFREAPGPIGPDCSATAEPLSCGASTGPILRQEDYFVVPGNAASGLDADRLRNDFRCIATVGTVSGEAGFERGLDAMQRSLSRDLLDTVNFGFRRPDAWLAIVFVTDENDCSHGGALQLTQNAECEWLRDDLVPVQSFIDFVNNSVDGTTSENENAEPGDTVLVAGIIGPDNGARPVRPQDPQPSCSSPDRGTAFAGYRYEEFIDSYGERGVQADICHDSFQVALDQIARVIRANLAVKCIRRVPPECESTLDCTDGATCDQFGTALRLCSNFEVAVEKFSLDDNAWVRLTADDDYTVNYEAAQCATGIGIEFRGPNAPRPGEDFRISYPIRIEPDPLGDSNGAEPQ